MNPQEDRLFFFFGGVAAAMSSLQVTSQQPCHALPLIPRPSGTPLKGERAGIYGCDKQESAHLNMKTRHCISGWGGGIPWGLWLDALSSAAGRSSLEPIDGPQML